MPIVAHFHLLTVRRGKIAHSDSHHIKEVICDMKLDALIKTFWRLLQRDNRLSQRERRTGQSFTRQWIVVSRHEEAGIIKAAQCQPLLMLAKWRSGHDCGGGGRSKTSDSILLEEACQRFVSCPQVQQVYYVTGDFLTLLVLNVRDIMEYEALTRELSFLCAQYKVFKNDCRDAKRQARQKRIEQRVRKACKTSLNSQWFASRYELLQVFLKTSASRCDFCLSDCRCRVT